jgi:hypothetical protein
VHELVVAARQVPMPSHDRGDDSVDPVQLAAPQLVPAAYLRQAPAPSHLPSVPQVVPPMSVHWVGGVGAVLTATGTQVPVAHVMQFAAQPVLQQMPPSQYPETHSIAVVHVEPFVFCTQTLPTQLYPVTQSELAAQLVLQVVAPQMYGLHDFSMPAAQVPEASQRPASVWAPAMHESMPQTVPTAYLRQAPAPSHWPSRPQVAAVASPH